VTLTVKAIGSVLRSAVSSSEPLEVLTELASSLAAHKLCSEVCSCCAFQSDFEAVALNLILRNLIKHRTLTASSRQTALEILEYAHTKNLLGEFDSFYFDVIASRLVWLLDC
jgi:hypothetical protein